MSYVDIESVFSYHPPLDEQTKTAHQAVRNECRTVAQFMEELIAECPEKTLAIRKLQEAMMFANSAIAQYGLTAKHYE